MTGAWRNASGAGPAWRLIDGAIGLIMVGIALKLAMGQGFPAA